VSAPHSARVVEVRGARRKALLTVIVPVYGEADVVENVLTIEERIGARLSETFELVVVSDGSLDLSSDDRLASERLRVIHYDRNLGKGYAVKVGALAAQGDWISYIDADLDLDPASIPRFLEIARKEELDFAIGSKRHPESVVHYPASRRVASWLYQQLIRALFRLNVRDTQVGLKVFRRDIAEQVVPLLLVKRYAFDLELLAVSRALGFGRIRELPITLHYRFSGSGVRSGAVMRALVDTAAVFYRLRLLRYYERKRNILLEATRADDYRPTVSLITRDVHAERLDYPSLDVVAPEDVDRAPGEVLAFVAPGSAPARNWISSAVPYLANPNIAAVVTPLVAPAVGSLRERAAAAASESRLGTGSLYFRFTPGNLRFVRDFPTSNVIVRRDDYLQLGAVPLERLSENLNKIGRRVLYTPDSIVVAPQPPLFRPYLEQVARYADVRAAALRGTGTGMLRASTVAPVAMLSFVILGWPALFVDAPWRVAWLAGVSAYALMVCWAALVAGVRFRSIRVGALGAAALLATHVVYALALLRGLVRRRQ
jgi:glycosyltransferase involved in cell wall biosynthesis